MGRFPSGQRGQTVNLLSTTSMVRIHLSPPFAKKGEDSPFIYRGVEQLAARRAHNPEVAGSSPASATKKHLVRGAFPFMSLKRLKDRSDAGSSPASATMSSGDNGLRYLH